MKIYFKINLSLLVVLLAALSCLPTIAGVISRPSNAKCDYGQHSPTRTIYVINPPDEAWKLEVDQYFKDKIDHLPLAEQVEKLKKEVKKLRKQLFDISKKADVKMEDDK